MAILQWNIRGLKSNYQPGLQPLIESQNPSIICLQETKLPTDNHEKIPGTTIPGYTSLHQIFTGGDKACGGNSIYVKTNLLYRKIPLTTPLQAIACRVTVNRPLTICSIYLPELNLDIKELHNLEKQLPKPFLILGDFNAHNPIWGSNSDPICRKGKTVEDFLTKTNLCILNDGSPTHIDIRSGKESAIDLTLCSSDIAADLQWSTIKDPHQSDHYPINIKQNIPITEPLPTRFIFKKAHWENFRTECEEKLNNTKNIKIEEFTEILLTIAENHIPQTLKKQTMVQRRMQISYKNKKQSPEKIPLPPYRGKPKKLQNDQSKSPQNHKRIKKKLF